MDELTGAEIVWHDEWYDGELDGVVRYQDRELWFCVDKSTRWYEQVHHERRFLVYELLSEELDRVHAVQMADIAAGAHSGPRGRRALGAPWGDEFGFAPTDRQPGGWFVDR